jgi:hypothetical protein
MYYVCVFTDIIEQTGHYQYHECSKNWDGSSKSMEPDMAVAMAHKMENDGFRIDAIHADNDSTTIKIFYLLDSSIRHFVIPLVV